MFFFRGFASSVPLSSPLYSLELGELEATSEGQAISSAFRILQAVISDLVAMNVMRRGQRFRRNRGTSRMCWFFQSIHS